tara:strand:- start:1696 stop:1836 length:141 start_codon:yes stop_codon:yes gene_type:complete
LREEKSAKILSALAVDFKLMSIPLSVLEIRTYILPTTKKLLNLAVI